jgi:glucosamine 6-phosphate synthetase-like amidotransferase/phosphosugar isomerase protein
MYKQAGRVTANYRLMAELLEDAKLLIGHCRYATHGAWSNNINNHPHPVDGGWFVHNGIIRTHRTLSRDYGLRRVTDCDSEVIGLLYEAHGGTRTQRLMNTVALVDARPLACLALWGRPRQLIAVRDGHPLHFCAVDGDCYIASLPEGLPGKAYAVKDRTGMNFSNKGVEHAKL